MYPSICLACDPDPRRARVAVARMLCELNAAGAPGVDAGSGSDWAAAVVPPPATEPTCGADLYFDGRDVLLWSGEILSLQALVGPSCFIASCGTVFPDGSARPGFGGRAAASVRAISAALLRSLQEEGIAALGRLDGAFCGAWYEARQARWHVFNDRFGLLPVFWKGGGGRLLAGPRASLVRLASGDPLRVDPLGVAGLLRTQNVLDDRTLISGVHWLQRGHTLAWDGGSPSLRCYADFADAACLITDPREAADAYLDVLRGCVRRHAEARAPLMLGISGGLDSRLFLAALHELDRLPACFSAGLAFGSDVRFGRRLARLAGAAHEWVALEPARLQAQLTGAITATDGLHNVGHLGPAAALRAFLRGRRGSVVLEGYFNGVAGGATIPPGEADTARPPHERDWARRMLHTGGSIELLDQLLEPRLARESRLLWEENVDRACREAASQDPLRQAEYAIQSAHRSRMDTLGTALLREEVLVRTPAADLAMVRWFESVPPAMRRARRLFLDVLRRHYPRFARVPRSDTGGMPISENCWLREYHWQREKLYRWLAGRRYPALKQWGTDGAAIRAWTFETLHGQGVLSGLMQPGARILEWVCRPALQELWTRAVADPREGMPVLGLWTIETMVRWLEQQEVRPAADLETSIHFRTIPAGGPAARGTVPRRPQPVEVR